MKTKFVIARSEATKQSSLVPCSGLLRFARNDGCSSAPSLTSPLWGEVAPKTRVRGLFPHTTSVPPYPSGERERASFDGDVECCLIKHERGR